MLRRHSACIGRSSLLAAAVFLLLTGCAAEDAANDTAPPISQQESATQAPANHESVRFGHGLADCYLGMPLEDLPGQWVPPLEGSKFFTNYNNHGRGIELAHRSGQVSAIILHFRSQKHLPFAGEIEGGITATSTIEDVIHTLGQPTSIGTYNVWTTLKDVGTAKVSLMYVEKGIDFSFEDKRLSLVRIFPPTRDPTKFLPDSGDTRAYRAIVPNSKSR